MDVFEAIYTRRSIREFKKGARVPEWKIERILDAGRWAPSPENMQFWRFLVIRDEDSKRFLADLSQEQAKIVFGTVPYEVEADRLWYLPERVKPKVIERVYDGSLFRYPEQADTVILPCASIHGIDWKMPYPITDYMQLVTVSMAAQNIWLAAHALGLGVGFNVLPLADHRAAEKVCRYFGIPDGVRPITVMAVGVPAQPRIAAPSRFPLEGICFSEYWGNPYKRIAFRGR